MKSFFNILFLITLGINISCLAMEQKTAPAWNFIIQTTIGGHTVPVALSNKNATIADLIDKVAEVTNSAEDEIRLVYSGKDISQDPTKLLEELSIPQNAKIHYVKKLGAAVKAKLQKDAGEFLH